MNKLIIRMKKMMNLTSVMAVLLGIFLMSSCSKKSGEKSTATGWSYNDPKWGGYEKSKNVEQETGPGLVLIEGGTFVMGNVEADIMYDYHNVPRRVTVSSFYMDECEVSNQHYRDYVYWTQNTFGDVYPELVKKALPDTLVWRSKLGYNEPYVEYYFRHPGFNEYPVVGVNWLQANEYAKWRSNRVNEMLMIDKGFIDYDAEQKGEDHFDTKSYLYGQYEAIEKKGMPNHDPNGEPTRKVRFSDGVMLPDYRLPTEAEWEYAALALIGATVEGTEQVTERRIYTWDGASVRSEKHGKGQGEILANFMRGRGDMMGVAGALNDNAEITAPVTAYLPNDFGLYNMSGNVSEWTLDVYRPMSTQDMDDFNPYRGNIFQTMDMDEENKPQRDSLGRIKYREYTQDEIGNRTNYRKSNVINYADGDEESGYTYETNMTTLISDKSRVIKGGSWRDRAYWLSPGTRRYMDEDQASSTVGFRCAMIRIGTPDGNTFKAPKNTKAKAKYKL